MAKLFTNKFTHLSPVLYDLKSCVFSDFCIYSKYNFFFFVIFDWYVIIRSFCFVLPSQGAGLVLEGRHNADMGWISELRRHGDALVIPNHFMFHLLFSAFVIGNCLDFFFLKKM
jgi:chitinase domain-containing protein 1